MNITAIDPGGSGVARIVWSATGAQTTPPTSVNGESAHVTITANGTTTVTFHAVDSAGNAGPSGNVTVKVDSDGPTVQCGTADGLWHANDVSIACTASDAGVGLADPLNDASFNLSTTVQAGTETANASTGDRNVCDRLAQCTIAGPIAGNMVDKKAPTITLTAPVAGSYTVGQVVNAAFTCVDGGSDVASCTGSTANGSAIPTTPGTHTFTVNATDNVGNAAATVTVTYTVAYRICLQYNPNQAKTIGSAYPIEVRLCDAAGNNLSSASISLQATTVDGTIDPGPNDSGNSNFGYFFRFDLGSYKYNLKTDGLSPGMHTLFFTVSTAPGVQFSAPFRLK